MNRPKKLSEDLQAFFRAVEGKEVVLGDLVDVAAERGFGLLFTFLGLTASIPILPPGYAATIGALFVFFSVQILAGIPHPWLPGRLRRQKMPRGIIEFLSKRATPMLARIERYTRHRPSLASPLVQRVAAVAALLMGLVMVAPIPFMNTLPAFAVTLIGAGMLGKDGIVMLAGTALGSVIATGLVLLFTLGGQFLSDLMRRLPWAS